MHAPLAGCALDFMAIGCRTQGIEITKRAPRGAQQHWLFFLTRNLAEPASVHDRLVASEAFLLRIIPCGRTMVVTISIHGKSTDGDQQNWLVAVVVSGAACIQVNLGPVPVHIVPMKGFNVARMASLLAVPTILVRSSPSTKQSKVGIE